MADNILSYGKGSLFLHHMQLRSANASLIHYSKSKFETILYCCFDIEKNWDGLIDFY